MADLVNSAPGQCRLQVDSTAQVSLQRYQGAYLPLKIGGVWEAKLIPSSGPTLANTGLTAATKYNIYAFDSGGTLTLEASTTAHVADSDVGVRIKSGDASRTLVGVASMGAGTPGTFQPIGRGTLSWFSGSPEGVLGGPLYKVVYPVTADFSWVNQETATLDDQFGFTRIANTTAGNSGFRARVQTAPSTPYQVDACLQLRDVPHANRHAGVIFRESSTSKIVAFYIFNDNIVRVAYWTNSSTWSSNPTSQTLEGSIIGSLQPVWLRIRDDGTNLKFSCSRDGLYYMTELSLARGAHFTSTGFPNQIGFAQIGEGATVPQATDFYHYLVS